LQSPQGSRDIVQTLSRIGHAQEFDGRYEDADATVHELNALVERYPFTTTEDLADHLDQQGRIFTRLGRSSEAEAVLERALQVLQQGAPSDASLSTEYANLGMAKAELGKNDEALAMFTKSVAAARRAFGPNDALLAEKLSPYASMLELVGRWDDAGEIYREAIGIRRKVLGPEHPEYAWTLNNYADHLVRRQRYAEAVPLAREVLALRGKTLPDTNIMVSSAMAVLGRALGPLGETEEADRLLHEALDLRRQNLPAGHWAIASIESMIGANLTLMKGYDEAESMLVASEQKLVAARGEGAPIIADARQRLVDLYTAWGKPEAAERWRRRLPGGRTVVAK
ncbi:MAG TPA: tetratricopeptide repeat protein, partial [Steroidobacteraceae bacterium]|nr:tetratricopeptide repeat protein [Steroidobacteraceae bacterium]